MKKILGILILSLFFFSNINAEERNDKLDKLFSKLKNCNSLIGKFGFDSSNINKINKKDNIFLKGFIS